MKLLILVNNPSRASFRLRAMDYLDYFRDEGIDFDVQQLPAGNFERWRLFRSSKCYDAILLHRKCLNYFDAKILFRYARKVIFDHDDAIMYSTSRPDSDRSSHFRLYKRTIQRCDCVIAGNEYLAAHARPFCSNVHILPTGLSVRSYFPKETGRPSETIRLVWIGSESTLRYLEELKPILEEIGQIQRQVVLRIIADKFFDLKNMTVEKYRWSLETQAADLQTCDIGLAPLPDNRFTRGKCGFKILQYFASGLPVIASPVGVNETFIKESGAGMLASTPRQWKEGIESMVNGIEQYRQLGEKGRCYVQAFDESAIAKRFCQIIKSLA